MTKKNNQTNIQNLGNNVVWDPASFMVSHHHSIEDAKNSDKPIKYIMGENGSVYEMRSTTLGDFVVKTDKVVGASNIKEGVSLNVPKMPFKLLLQAVSFFRDVCDQFSDDEAMVQFWYDKQKKEFFPVCLEQTTTKTHITYLRKEELETDPNMILVMDIHSHNTMSAFFSATDDASEQETRTYGVIGRLDKEIPEYKFRLSVEGEFREMKLTDLFEMPKVKMFSDDFETETVLKEKDIFFPDVDFPSEWLDIIEEGKKNRSKFSGKGNFRRHSFGKTSIGGSVGTGKKSFPTYPSLANLVDNDPYALIEDDGTQMSLFDSDKGYQYNALRTGEGFGREESHSVDDEDLMYFSDMLQDQFDLLEDDPERRVDLLSGMVSGMTTFEVKMLIDRMLEIGYDQEIIDQMKEVGYRLSDK